MRRTNPRALIVFAKVPVPGQVKTRLTPLLSEAQAAQLYEAFLRDALDQYRALDTACRLYVNPPVDALPDGLVLPDVSVHAQRGDGLGVRMQQAFLETFAAGYEQIVVIGTDHPTLPRAFIEQAFRALEEPLAISIGPSNDGGYYLLGLNEFYPSLFDGMQYSQPDVFAQTIQRAFQTSGRLTVLPPWYDVDTPADLQRLRQDLETSEVAAVRTRRVLEELAEDAAAPEGGA